MESGIEDCIDIHPSQHCIREVTVIHIGGLKNIDNQAEGFGRAPFIRRNFVDCGFKTSETTVPPSQPFSSHFLTGGPGMFVTYEDPPQIWGLFVSKRPHSRTNDELARFYNLNDPASRWNGYFPVLINDANSLYANLTTSQGTTDESSLVIMGTEFRAIAVTSCHAAVVEQNQIFNCWIGGPYASPLYDPPAGEPTPLPTLEEEEHRDPLNALNIRSLIVRSNYYKNVAVGPYWNMGGVSGAVTASNISYSSGTGLVTVTTAKNHKLWLGARVKIESAPNPAYEGVREISEITNDTTFKYALAAGLVNMSSGTASYRVVSGVDYLTIDGNTIELADLDETEFGIKEYPLASSPASQLYRAYGIVVGDNGVSALAGPHAHRQVFLRNNQIRYVEGQREPTVAGLARPAGGGMQLAGIKQLHATHNVVDVNLIAGNKLRTFRCGAVRFFHNTSLDGQFITGWKGDVEGHYDEPESLAEDAFILSLFERRRG